MWKSRGARGALAVAPRVSMKAGAAGRLEEIDVLRGLAAMVVVLSHYSTHCVKFFQQAPFGFQLDTIYGFYAVQLFFIISGFVISLTIEKSRSWRDFAFSRFSRLYPCYWAAITLMVLLEMLVFRQKFWVGGYVTNLTMLQEFLGFPNLDNVFWTLTVELAFYAIMGALFAIGLFARIELVAASWLAVACVWSLVDQYLAFGVPEMFARVFILRHVPFFVAGITFYRVVTRGMTRRRLALILAAFVAAGWIDGLPGPSAPAVELGDFLRRTGVAAILFTIFGAAILGWLRLTISPATLWLGGISYSLYLSHRNLGYSTLSYLLELNGPVAVVFLAAVAGALVVAAALTYLVEQPSLRILRQWYRIRAISPQGIQEAGTS